MLEIIWAPFFFKPEKATNNTAALVVSKAVAAQPTSPKFGTGITAETDTAKVNQATN